MDRMKSNRNYWIERRRREWLEFYQVFGLPAFQLSKFFQNWSKLLWVVFCLLLALSPGRVSAQEPAPPFWFDAIPTAENGRITYRINFYSRVEWPMPDLTIRLPVPEGTRFLEGKAQPGVSVNLEGREVIFFTSAFNRYLDTAWFTVEVTDPTMTVFTTQPHLTWKGDRPGDYLTEPISFDITRPILDWSTPPQSRLQLGISTIIADDVLTYALYPKAVDRQRMWDVRVNVPLPAGVDFLAVEAPSTFTAGFDGREVSFFTLELPRQAEIEPLIFRVSTAGLTDPLVLTHAWASWKNAGYAVGATIPADEQTMTDIVVAQPRTPQHIVFDSVGDVPLPDYDLTSVAFQEDGVNLSVIFNLAGTVGAVGQPLQYALFIDSDCQGDTGMPRQHRGAEYRVNYDRARDRATITSWDAAVEDWRWEEVTRLDASADNQTITISLPYQLIGFGQQFCWVAQTRNQTETYNSDLPNDWLPNERFVALTQHEIGSVVSNPINGKLAIPLNNSQGFYDVSVFALPRGREIVRLPNARQPSFRADGQKLLTNHESVAAENLYEQNLEDGRTVVYVLKNSDPAETIYEYDFTTSLENQVSDGPLDSFPFYNLAGNQVMYTNLALTGSQADLRPSIFLQCGLRPPRQEAELSCQNLAEFGMLMGDGGEIRGSYPVWADADMIAYQSCSAETQPIACGIHLVSAQARKGLSEGTTPIQLTQHRTDLPTDAKLSMITFSSQRSGDWEAYAINMDGSDLRNLSNSPTSQDGLPAISPNGQWVAFVSDRQGSWAVWVASISGGEPQKLFDLPTDTPWGNGDRAWTNERISWGP